MDPTPLSDLTANLTDAQRTPENLKRLYEKHVVRYKVMLRAHMLGDPGYRGKELMDLLAVWNAVKVADFRWEHLTKAAQVEVYDAVLSGE